MLELSQSKGFRTIFTHDFYSLGDSDDSLQKDMVEGKTKPKPSPDAPTPVDLSKVKTNTTSTAGKDAAKNNSSTVAPHGEEKKTEKDKEAMSDDKATKTPMPSMKLNEAKDKSSNLTSNNASASTPQNTSSNQHKLTPTHDDEAQLQPLEHEKDKATATPVKVNLFIKSGIDDPRLIFVGKYARKLTKF